MDSKYLLFYQLVLHDFSDPMIYLHDEIFGNKHLIKILLIYYRTKKEFASERFIAALISGKRKSYHSPLGENKDNINKSQY